MRLTLNLNFLSNLASSYRKQFSISRFFLSENCSCLSIKGISLWFLRRFSANINQDRVQWRNGDAKDFQNGYFHIYDVYNQSYGSWGFVLSSLHRESVLLVGWPKFLGSHISQIKPFYDLIGLSTTLVRRYWSFSTWDMSLFPTTKMSLNSGHSV